MPITPFLAGETADADEVNDAIDEGPKGIVALAGPRITVSTTTTSIVGYLRLDDVELTGGRAYKIVTTPINLTSSTGTDDVRALMKYTTDGSTPSTASTTIPGGLIGTDIAGGSSATPIMPMIIQYNPSVDELLSLLLCVQRVAGAGNAQIYADSTQAVSFWVEDIGIQVANTGTSI